jgi:hypothetical protein
LGQKQLRLYIGLRLTYILGVVISVWLLIAYDCTKACCQILTSTRKALGCPSSLRRPSRRRSSRPRGASSPNTSIGARGRLRHCDRWPLTDSDICLSTSLLTLNTHDHVVLLAKLQPRCFPCAEVVACVDGAAAVHLSTDRPVLLEVGVVAKDGWRVNAFLLPDLIGRTVCVEVSEVVCASIIGWVVFAH